MDHSHGGVEAVTAAGAIRPMLAPPAPRRVSPGSSRIRDGAS